MEGGGGGGGKGDEEMSKRRGFKRDTSSSLSYPVNNSLETSRTGPPFFVSRMSVCLCACVCVCVCRKSKHVSQRWNSLRK